MFLLNHLGGLRWGFYEESGTVTEVVDCAFANYGLHSVFVTSTPIHIFVFETLSGNILGQYKEESGTAYIENGLETRL